MIWQPNMHYSCKPRVRTTWTTEGDTNILRCVFLYQPQETAHSAAETRHYNSYINSYGEKDSMHLWYMKYVLLPVASECYDWYLGGRGLQLPKPPFSYSLEVYQSWAITGYRSHYIHGPFALQYSTASYRMDISFMCIDALTMCIQGRHV